VNTISFPQSPFFCADEGGYLPALTDLNVGAVAMQKRVEIEEELLKLRLRRACFAALAVHCPQSVVHSQSTAREDARPTMTAEEHNRFPKGRW
jgi:hypothetical protein